MKLRLHCLSPAHTIGNKDFGSCAYTQAARYFCKGMSDRDHYVAYYGNELSDVKATEIVNCVTTSEFEQTYGSIETQLNNNHHVAAYGHDCGKDYAYRMFNGRAIHELKKRIQEDDIILCFFGAAQRVITDELIREGFNVHVVEPFVGYSKTFARYRVFPSYFKMAYQYGEYNKNFEMYQSLNDEAKSRVAFDPNTMIHYSQTQWHDAVITGGFDLDEFSKCEEKEDHALYVGRIMKGKGLEMAIKLAEYAGKELLIAGMGNFKEAMGYDPPKHVKLLGTLNIEDRNEHMAKASVGMCISYYLEPLCYTPIEFMMNGTIPLGPDYGGPAETILHKHTGFKVRSYDHGEWCIDNLNIVNPETSRKWAEDNYSLKRTSEKYEEYFIDLLAHINAGKDNDMWYTTDRKDLDRFTNYYPKSND